MTEVLCELELTIKRVKVSTTPDGKVMDLFFITDSRFLILQSRRKCSFSKHNLILFLLYPLNYSTRELLHTKKRRDDTCDHLKAVLGEGDISFEIEKVGPEITSSSQEPSFFSDGIAEEMFNAEMLQENEDDLIAFRCPSITMDNTLSPSHTLVQIICQDHKGLLYDVMRTLKDCDIQVSMRLLYCQVCFHRILW